MKPVEIKPNIYWTGAIDWAVRDFHGYIIPNGTTYNNYLIMDDEITLIDAVKEDFADVGLGNIRDVVDPSKIKNDEFVTHASHVELEDATLDYYANILAPFGALVKNKIAEIEKMRWEIDMIAPDHGIIWRSDPPKALRIYREMASGKAKLRVVVIFDTMWRNTEMMTQPIILGHPGRGGGLQGDKAPGHPHERGHHGVVEVAGVSDRVPHVE